MRIPTAERRLDSGRYSAAVTVGGYGDLAVGGGWFVSSVIVTPYFPGSPELLQRCIDSVVAQTVETEHILVADGTAQDWIDETNGRSAVCVARKPRR
ncbi:hypothetical protein [Nocardia sienata]|uniref:hypothetical protein n=1 Tax=Nocardia sienata TaxID=248552 RepID=UPI0007A3AAC3|nr:hypothetical protein [Nocardia sienata]